MTLLLLLTVLVLLVLRTLVHALLLDGYGTTEPPRSHVPDVHERRPFA